MTRFRCQICGNPYWGSTPPEVCPVCEAPWQYLTKAMVLGPEAKASLSVFRHRLHLKAKGRLRRPPRPFSVTPGEG